METRIRHFRQQRRWTLQALAERVGTTAQTVQRLETANMTVSTDWLEKFAQAFGVHPADLIAGRDEKKIRLLGALGKNGLLRLDTEAFNEDEDFVLDVPADDPVGFKLDSDCGPYRSGSLLIANRLRGDDMDNVVGQDAFAALENGTILLRRIIRGQNNSFTLVPLEPGGETRYNQNLNWVGRLVMVVAYL